MTNVKKIRNSKIVFSCVTLIEKIVSLFQDGSFAEILHKNPHITLIRNSKKGNASQPDLEAIRPPDKRTELEKILAQKWEEAFNEPLPPKNQSQQPPYMPTPTRRGEPKRPIILSDDSIELNPLDMWEVSDQSFVEMEQLCQSPQEIGTTVDVTDTTLICDIEAPSFFTHDSDTDSLLDDSVFERSSSVSMLSPMKQVALRRPSTILEESTIQSINSSEERSGSSLSLKHSIQEADESHKSIKSRSFRPSILNVFPTRSRIGFYDGLETPSSKSAEPAVKRNKERERSINLMRFDSVESTTSKPATEQPAISVNSSNLLDKTIDETLSPNMSVDQTFHNSSMSDSDPPDQFNDTLEAVECFMKQGKKIMDKSVASKTILQPTVVMSPKNRSNSLLKQTLARRHLMSINNSDNSSTKKKLF